jgi:hypothetical protein
MERGKRQVAQLALLAPLLVLAVEFVPGGDDRERLAGRFGPLDDAVALAYRRGGFDECRFVLVEGSVYGFVSSVTDAGERQVVQLGVEWAVGGNIARRGVD